MHGRDIFLPGLHGEDYAGGWQMPRMRLQREYGKRAAPAAGEYYPLWQIHCRQSPRRGRLRHHVYRL